MTLKVVLVADETQDQFSGSQIEEIFRNKSDKVINKFLHSEEQII